MNKLLEDDEYVFKSVCDLIGQMNAEQLREVIAECESLIEILEDPLKYGI